MDWIFRNAEAEVWAAVRIRSFCCTDRSSGSVVWSPNVFLLIFSIRFTINRQKYVFYLKIMTENNKFAANISKALEGYFGRNLAAMRGPNPDEYRGSWQEGRKPNMWIRPLMSTVKTRVNNDHRRLMWFVGTPCAAGLVGCDEKFWLFWIFYKCQLVSYFKDI